MWNRLGRACIVCGLLAAGCGRQPSEEESNALVAMTEEVQPTPEVLAAAEAARQRELREQLSREQSKEFGPLLAEVNARLDRLVEAQIRPEAVAQELGLPWPPPQKAVTLEEFRRLVAKEMRETVDERYPESRFDEIRREAENRYKTVPVGEEISFVIREGRGVNTVVSGRLNEVGRDHVRVGDRRIIMEDMSRVDLARVLPEVCEEVRQGYIRRRDAQLFEARREYLNSLVEPRVEEIGRYIGAVGHTYVGVQVCLPRDLIDAATEARREALRGKLRPSIEREVFTAAGCERIDGRWRRPGGGAPQ